MAIDAAITDSMLGTFRNMYKECVDKNASGDAFDRMKTAIERMESLAKEHSDIMAFQGQMMQENLMGNFGIAYGEAVAEMSKPKDGGGGYDDKALLEQTIQALKDALKRLDEGVQQQVDEIKKHAKPGEEIRTKTEIEAIYKDAERNKPIIDAIQELIKLGESCETLPSFLRIQMEKGMDKAMDGSAVVKSVYEEDVVLQKIHYLSPYHQERSKEILDMFNRLEAAAPFGVPESVEVEMERTKIEHKFQPEIEKWDKVKDEWKSIIDDIAYWAASQCPRAPRVDPWVMMQDPGKTEHIKFVKNCNPAIIDEKLRIFKENHGYNFKDIFTLESFKYEVTDHKIYFSQEYMVHLVNVIYPQCKTGNFLSQELIDTDMKFYNENKMYDPEPITSIVKYIEWFNTKYGAGSYEKRFDAYNPKSTAAAKWNYEEFISLLKF